MPNLNIVICPGCGSELSVDNRGCPNCGYENNEARKRDFSVRSRADIAKSEIRRERYERFLRGSVAQQPVEKRIAESRAKREAAQRIGTNKSK